MSNSYIYSDGPPFVPPPDNVTIPQFMFGTTHPARPMGDPKSPCIIDDESGKGLSLHEVILISARSLSYMKANAGV
ncbi:hypothetical protein PHLCEN_2v5271 [Hermanssonia centrifuga]|uniref:Uncharacterized protein n=1 Tax=Hermanssonia centrifuga TaxID=98765 RepID=A0A2R6P8P4_9APHY|nr:hypothetical protein PHLCEN_2v5271 [Hermanssonia centrifuga]